MDTRTISGAIGGAAAMVILKWLLSKVRPAPSAALEGGRKVLRYHAGYTVIHWVGLVFFAAFSVLASLSPRVPWWCLGVFASLALLSATGIVLHRRWTLAYEDDYILYGRFLGPPIRFSWADIEAVSFSSIAQSWQLQLRDGRSAGVSTDMNGTLEFLGTLMDKTGLHVAAVRLPDGRALDPGPYSGSTVRAERARDGAPRSTPAPDR